MAYEITGGGGGYPRVRQKRRYSSGPRSRNQATRARTNRGRKEFTGWIGYKSKMRNKARTAKPKQKTYNLAARSPARKRKASPTPYSMWAVRQSRSRARKRR